MEICQAKTWHLASLWLHFCRPKRLVTTKRPIRSANMRAWLGCLPWRPPTTKRGDPKRGPEAKAMTSGVEETKLPAAADGSETASSSRQPLDWPPGKALKSRRRQKSASPFLPAAAAAFSCCWAHFQPADQEPLNGREKGLTPRLSSLPMPLGFGPTIAQQAGDWGGKFRIGRQSEERMAECQ
jgi:hypothetical protein